MPIVFVFGDHGMTESGDHGGATADEVGAALFVCAPAALLPVDAASGAPLRWFQPAPGDDATTATRTASAPQGAGFFARALTRDERVRELAVDQIALVPTLSLLLGLPIPFSNLGGVMPELFHDSDDDAASAPSRRRSS